MYVQQLYEQADIYTLYVVIEERVCCYISTYVNDDSSILVKEIRSV